MIFRRPAKLPDLNGRLAFRTGSFVFLLSFLLVCKGHMLLAQNRVLVNPSFEPPYTPQLAPGTMKFVNASNSISPQIKGWNTTASDFQIEVWHDGMEGYNAHTGLGKQWVELNANMISRLYENVCLVRGEVLKWKYYHRGRGSSTIPDEMELNIYDKRGVKVATLQKASTTSHAWKEYSGSYVVDFPTGSYELSFEAIRSASGSSSVGNFLDGITIELSPLVQFSAPAFSGYESTSKNVPRLILNGTVPHGGGVVTIQAEGGAAVLREDFLFPVTLNIPAGIYSPANLLIIPLSIMNDNIVESDEEVRLSLISATGGIKIMDADCDGIFYSSTVYTILDDDSASKIVRKEEVQKKVEIKADPEPDNKNVTTAIFNNKKIKTSDSVNLNILFEQGTDVITRSSEEELLELLRFMKKNKKAEIELEGHTEKDETTYTKRQKELNVILSERRVKKIKNYLMNNGIREDRIQTIAYGGTRPVSVDPAKNRRVVMKVLKL